MAICRADLDPAGPASRTVPGATLGLGLNEGLFKKKLKHPTLSAVEDRRRAGAPSACPTQRRACGTAPDLRFKVKVSAAFRPNTTYFSEHIYRPDACPSLAS